MCVCVRACVCVQRNPFTRHTVYLQPEVIWADGSGDAPCTHDSIKYWKSPEFLSWVYNESPVKMTTVANNR